MVNISGSIVHVMNDNIREPLKTHKKQPTLVVYPEKSVSLGNNSFKSS